MGHGVGACFSSFFGGEKNKYWRREQSMVFLVWLCGLGLEFWIIIFTLLSPYYYFLAYIDYSRPNTLACY